MPAIGSNLQTYSTAGSFSGDRSTWGWSSLPNSSVNREIVGAYARAKIFFVQSISVGPAFKSIPGRFNIVSGKKYIASARVAKVSASNDTDAQIKFDFDTPADVSVISSGPANIPMLSDAPTGAPGEYSTINVVFTALVTQTNYTKLGIYIVKGTDEDPMVASLLVDDFEIYEYTDPVPECLLEIDTENTVVNAESTEDDGSIAVAVTGAAGDVEYSLDGFFWQDSNVFAGLSDGLYTVRAREKDTISCTAEQSFYINQSIPALVLDAIDVTNESISGAADGQIVVTVSAGTIPYQYSKDGGATFQGSNSFTGLLPGTYTIVVKDDNDETVAQNVTVLAGVYNFTALRYAKNPILFDQAQGANSAEDNYRITCEVQVIDSEGVFTEALTTERPPDAAGNAQFNVRLAFDGYFNPIPPARGLGGFISHISDRSVRARNRFGELWDIMTVPAVYLTTQPYLVLLGGIEKRPFAEIDFFNTWLPTNKKFLSWKPVVRTVDLGQEDFISFLVYNQEITTLKSNIKAYYDDDTDTTQEIDTITAVSFGEIYEFMIGPYNSDVLSIDPLKNLVKYEFWLTDQDDTVISEVITMKLSEFKKTSTRYYLFLNSLGSFEVLRTTGLTTEEADIRKDIINVFLPAYYDADQGEEASHNPVNQRMREVSSGYQVGKEWLEWFQDFRLSEEVYDITDGKRRKVNIEASKMALPGDQDYRYFMRFIAREAYRNEVFTPKSVQ